MKNKPREIRYIEILNAAERCFSEKGLRNTTIDDIASEANLTKGGVYWHFKNKRELYIALIEKHLQEDIEIWKSLMAVKKIGSEEIIKAGISYLRYYMRNKNHIYLHAEFFTESFKDDLLKMKLKEVHNKWRIMTIEALNRALQGMEIEVSDVTIRDISILILSCIEGITHQYWLDNKNENISSYEKTWVVFTTLLFKGLKVQRGKDEKSSTENI